MKIMGQFIILFILIFGGMFLGIWLVGKFGNEVDRRYMSTDRDKRPWWVDFFS
jgi:hypothetical protein